MQQRSTLSFLLNGRPITVDHLPPHTLALPWLRGQGLVSVKEGCGEGDCGACTIALGTPNGDGLTWRAVNACLLLLGQLDGLAVLTTEGLKAHPVQTGLAEGYGTQCGFCTPGFVMSLFAFARQPHRDTETTLQALAGNLCRCTGYRPIIEAARALPLDPPTAEEQQWAEALRAMPSGPLRLEDDRGRLFLAPTTLDGVLEALAAHPGAWIVAGGTDQGLRITKRGEEPGVVLSLARVADLLSVTETDTTLTLGAAVPYHRAAMALTALVPAAAGVLDRIGATQIRNMGTLGGNLGTASPIGDSAPLLIALGAEVELASPGQRRRLPVEDFFTGYRATVLEPGEVIAALHIPRPPAGTDLRAYKIAKRFDQDISTVSACFALRRDKTTGRVGTFRAAYGGVADRPVRVRACEAAVLGQPWTAETITAAQAALEITPRDDLRGSASYRRTVAANLLTRFHLETTAAPGPLRVEDVA